MTFKGANLFRGHPTKRLLPNDLVLEAFQYVLGRPHAEYNDFSNRNPLDYGPDNGAEFVRERYAKWTRDTLGSSSTGDCITLTNGASYGLTFALTQCTSPSYTKQIFVVSPTYFLVNDILENEGFRPLKDGSRFITAIKETQYGIDIAHLQHWLETNGEPASSRTDSCGQRHEYRYVLYFVPNFGNPTGSVTAEKDLVRLLGLARLYDILIITDEVYNWLSFNKPPSQLPRLLVSLDRATLSEHSWGNTIANFSTSKLLGPGLRVGWQETATPEFAAYLAKMGSIKSGGTPSQLNTMAVARMMENGAIDKIIAHLNDTYSDRAMQVRAAILENFPEGTVVQGGHGGYFIWVTLPKRYNVPEITAACALKNIVLASGDHFEVRQDPLGWGEQSFRVSYSLEEADVLVEAVKQWAEIVQTHKPK